MADGEDEVEIGGGQWMTTCDDCDNLVEQFCTTCGDKLCGDCKDRHLSRKKNRHHEVVPYSEGMRAHKQSVSTCPKHPSEPLLVYCRPCQTPICTPCITETHRSHELISIVEAFSAAKEKATSALKQLLTQTRPTSERALEEARDSVEKIEDSIKRTETEMKRCARLLHDKVDDILDKHLKELHTIRDESLMPKARDVERNITRLNNDVRITIRKYEDNLRSENPIDLIMFMNDKSTEDPNNCFSLPNTENPVLPLFRPGTISEEILRGQFGSLKFDGANLKSSKSSETTDTGDKVQGAHALDVSGIKNQGYGKKHSFPSIMRSPDLEYEVNLEDLLETSLTGLRCQSKSRLWIAQYNGKIFLAAKDGSNGQGVDVGCRLYSETGMQVTDGNELVFTDVDQKSLRKISPNSAVTTFFATGECKPYGFCLFKDKVLICMPDEGLLRIFTSKGHFRRDIGKGHLQCPMHIAVNRINDDICVSDHRRQVVVFGCNGVRRFTYTGDGSAGTGFDPRDLCCDQLGNILVTDCKNNRVHIVDRDGNFLQYLVSGTENISRPIAIDVGYEGKVFVGENKTRKVKVFKYLN